MADAAEQPIGGPIFVVGSLGSGSTLLRLILDSHEHIAIPQETGFMRAVLANQWLPFWNFGDQWYRRLGMSEDDLLAELAGFYARLFERYAGGLGKRRWGDKTPYHVWHVPTMARMFPDAVFVGIVRHPGAVAASLHRRFDYAWPRAVRHWVSTNLQLVRDAEVVGDRMVLCRYEDLVESTEPTMRELLGWLGEPWSPAVVAHHEVQRRRRAPREVEGHTRSDQPVDETLASRWVNDVDDDVARLLTVETAALAAYFGYRVCEPGVAGPLVGSAGRYRWLASGSELLRQRADHPDVDWSTQPDPGVANQLLTPQVLTALRSGLPVTAPRPASLPRRLVRRLPARTRERLRRWVRRSFARR